MQEKDLKEIIFDLKNKTKEILKKYGRIIFIVFTFILFLVSLFFYQILLNKKDLEVDFLDVGQGDAILIKTRERKNILLDAGSGEIIIKRLEEKLSIFDRKIDLAIFSHPDSDHVAGFFYVFKKYNIEKILTNGDENKESETYKAIDEKINKEIEDMNSKFYKANCGDKIYLDKENSTGKEVKGENKNGIIYILHPNKNNLISNDTNENSIVFLLIYGDYSFLFTGDMDKEVEKRLFYNLDFCFNKEDGEIIKNSLKNLTVLKVSHHGSNSASSESFLRQIKPEYSIISAGKDNKYGHPNKETLEILKKYSKIILNTVENGNISFKTDAKNLQIIKQK